MVTVLKSNTKGKYLLAQNSSEPVVLPKLSGYFICTGNVQSTFKINTEVPRHIIEVTVILVHLCGISHQRCDIIE